MLLGDTGLGMLARALWPLQNITILEVMNTGMTDDGALEFVTTLVRGPSVRAGGAVLELSLRGCEIVNTKGETCSTYLTISAPASGVSSFTTALLLLYYCFTYLLGGPTAGLSPRIRYLQLYYCFTTALLLLFLPAGGPPRSQRDACCSQ